MPELKELLQALHRAGLRSTVSRRAIAETIVGHHGAFTAQEVWHDLASEGVGRATVFRTLNLLADLGLLNRLHTGDGCHSYSLCEPHHHHHLVCTDCGQVIPLESCYIEQQVRPVADEKGFLVEGHHMEVFGRCASCRPDCQRDQRQRCAMVGETRAFEGDN